MKRRGFIAILSGALGVTFVLPVRPPPCIGFIDAGTTIYIDPAIESCDQSVTQWFKVRNGQLEELFSRVCDGNQ